MFTTHTTQVTPFFNCSLTSGNTSLLMPLPVWCHTVMFTTHTTQVTPFFNCSLTSSNTSLLMPCHTARSNTGHPMFQLLTLTRFKQHQSADALPHSKVKHSWSPHVSTAHGVTLTHFKQHQSADAPITQHCSPHTGW